MSSAIPAKAPVPVCTNGSDCKTPTALVLERVLTQERQWMCDGCYFKVEQYIGRSMAFETTGTPYDGPERLPRPRMAHVGGMHDEDLCE